LRLKENVPVEILGENGLPWRARIERALTEAALTRLCSIGAVTITKLSPKLYIVLGYRQSYHRRESFVTELYIPVT
jgi:hypothetical protein